MATARRPNCGACRAFRRDPMGHPERIFVLTLRAPRDEARTTRALRWVLKELLRRHGLTCVDIQEISETMEEAHEPA